MPNKTIRLATEQDAPALLAMYAPYVQNTTITFEYDVPTLADFTGRITSIAGRLPWLVCEENHTPVGYAYASAFGERPGFNWTLLVSVYVMQEWQGKGVGSALYAALEKIVAKQRYLTLYARVAVPGPQSENFHLKMGYKKEAVLQDVGCKFGEMLSLCYFKKHLNPIAPSPKPTVPLAALPAQTMEEILGNVIL